MPTQLEVRRKSFAETRIVDTQGPQIGDGEILLAIDKFALTANNVSYALSGETIGYWKFYPVDEPWGIVPVWGFADVIASRHPEITVGERMWGFLPMASQVVLKPVNVSAGSFSDGAAHRRELAAVYNNYQRTSGDSAGLKALEDERCLLFPLFSTSYVLYDYLVDNEFFGARQVLVGSASSKTGLGLTNLLARHAPDRPRVTGLTSPGNVEFVRKLGTCDNVVTYDAIGDLDGSVPSAFVDMAGSRDVVAAIHAKFGANLKLSSAVGATHWEAGRFRGGADGVPHTFFFAPGQFAKREKEWGRGEIFRRAQVEAARMSQELKRLLTIRHIKGGDALAATWQQLVSGIVAPDVGIMGSFT